MRCVLPRRRINRIQARLPITFLVGSNAGRHSLGLRLCWKNGVLEREVEHIWRPAVSMSPREHTDTLPLWQRSQLTRSSRRWTWSPTLRMMSLWEGLSIHGDSAADNQSLCGYCNVRPTACQTNETDVTSKNLSHRRGQGIVKQQCTYPIYFNLSTATLST